MQIEKYKVVSEEPESAKIMNKYFINMTENLKTLSTPL